ncbi:hypothetical protein LCGC14_2295940 [marine sediment metagenome]|uniref:Uncharacterized protein n=1 Tax=marine sediment metagenome TaxID=412755 RepID=A0A0F9CQE9_9ZZZZ
MEFSTESNADMALLGIPIQDVYIRVLPQNRLARLLWRFLRLNIQCTWAELPEE